MSENPVEGHFLDNALGSGWLMALVALVVGVIGAISGWAAKRPLEKAGVMEAVTSATQALIAGQDQAIRRITEALEKCQREHDEKNAKIDVLDGRLHQLEGEVRQYQQLERSRIKP